MTPNDPSTAALTPPTGPASATAAVLAALATAQGMMSSAVTDYFNDATQVLSDANTALGNAQSDATTALGNALFDLTNANTQLRTDATNGYTQAVAATNTAYSDARAAINTAWGELQVAVTHMSTAATDANAATVTASANLLTELDGQFASIAIAMGQEDTAINNDRNAAGATASSQISGHEAQWNREYHAYSWRQFDERLQTVENWVNGAQMATIPFLFFPATTPIAILVGMGLGVVNLGINVVQGDGLGITFAAVDVVTGGIGAKVKGAVGFLGRAMGKSDEVVTVVKRVASGCFATGTLTDVAADDADALSHVEWLFCLTGCGALVLLTVDRERRRRKRAANIEQLFASDPWNELWE